MTRAHTNSKKCVCRGCKNHKLPCKWLCASGTTGIVAVRHGRRFIGVELSPDYCRMARERISAIEHGNTVQEERAGQQVLFVLERDE